MEGGRGFLSDVPGDPCLSVCMGSLIDPPVKHPYDEVYERAVPKEHFLRQLGGLISWYRLMKRLKSFYQKAGRDARNPVMMFKLPIIQFL
jgi:hypothetical protein